MDWVTVIWGGLIGGCIAIATPHLLVGIRARRSAHLFFSLAAIAVVGIAIAEIGMMRATTVEQIGHAQRWTHLPIFFLYIALVMFVRYYFGTGRLWLAWAVCSLRFVSLIINFAMPTSLNFRQITALQPVHIFGETVVRPVGVPNPWTRLGELCSLLLLAYVVDASIGLWRSGTPDARRRAAVVGGSLTLFILLAAGMTALIHRGVLEAPYMVSFPFAAILVAMAFELGSDLFGASQVAQKLRLSEASLVESEVRFHHIEQRVALAAEAAQLGVWEVDLETNALWVSDKVHELLQFGPDEEITYEAFQRRVHPEDRAAREAAIQRAIDTDGAYEMEFRVILPDGTMRWLAGRACCLTNPDKTRRRLLGVAADVTKRKQAEELFRLATEASPSGILLVDRQGRIVLVNAHIEDLFGYDRDELIGQPVEILVPERFTASHQKDRSQFLTYPMARKMAPGRELFARRKNGEEFPVEIGLNPIATAQGILVLATVTDVSARRAAEQEARRRREQIELLSRVSLLGEMTASIAHELNQPLTAIVSNASAGQRFIDQGNLDAENLREILVDVGADGRRAHEIIQNIRNTIKKGAAVREQIDINKIVENVSHLVHPNAIAHSCEVDISLTRDLPAVRGDPVQIQQILINLVTNAFESMDSVPTGKRKVEITTASNGNGSVCVSVRDHGSGIADDIQPRLFDQFFTTKEEGLGMGLAIARSLVENHGGSIAVENAEGGGARFQVELPIEAEA